MRVAFLIQCHKSPEQVNTLLNALNHKDFDFFIHVDKKSDISDRVDTGENIHLLPDEFRVDVCWGQFSQVEAAVNLLTYAKAYDDFDYYCQISGQDFPICSPEKIHDFFSAQNGSNFIHLSESRHWGAEKPTSFDKRAEVYYPEFLMTRGTLPKLLRAAYKVATGGFSNTFSVFKRKYTKDKRMHFGSCWWCLHGEFVNYLLKLLQENPHEVAFYKNVICSDEVFFQTFFMNSPYRDTRKEDLHYIDWSHGGSSPKTLEADDFTKIINSGKLFARKLESGSDLIELLSKHISET